MEKSTQIIEALIFAAGNSIERKDIQQKLGLSKAEVDKAIENLTEKYSDDSGVLLLRFNEKLQFSSNPKYGGVIADILVEIKEKELSKTLLEVLAIVAYKQPITKLEIEDLRGVGSDYAIQMLEKLNMVEVVGRKEAVGRPSLFGTTEEFLKKFKLHNLNNLPKYEEILDRLQVLNTENTVSLFREVGAQDPFADTAGEEITVDMPNPFSDEIPEHLIGEEFIKVVS